MVAPGQVWGLVQADRHAEEARGPVGRAEAVGSEVVREDGHEREAAPEDGLHHRDRRERQRGQRQDRAAHVEKKPCRTALLYTVHPSMWDLLIEFKAEESGSDGPASHQGLRR